MCGIIGITNHKESALKAYLGLLLLQHRGQDSAGIMTYDFAENSFHEKKELGLVNQVFSEKSFENLKGGFAIGHTRYSTVGLIERNDIQPMLEKHPYGMGAVHNGNVKNINQLKKMANLEDRYISSNNDLELLMYFLGKNLLKFNGQHFFDSLIKSVQDILNHFEGGFSYIGMIAGKGMVAFTDRYGIRPLLLGKKDQSYILCSETSVIDFLEYEFVREVKAGEVIYIDQDGNFFSEQITFHSSHPCMFEWIYFSGAESKWFNKSMYDVRLSLGKSLAKKIAKLNLEIDYISPVPDTSRSAGIALSEELDIPYREVLIKNRYVQRSFILNTQEKRNKAVNLKFSVVRNLVKDKNILLIDDSIVRGTTSKKIIQLLLSNGAKNVYLASTCPPILSPCSYGIDFPSKDELIFNRYKNEELKTYLSASEVIYTDLTDLQNALELKDFCHGCLTGEYLYERTDL